tara:strand:+ start:5969 stop:7858 length:1890 start_codon:yes stop_codon:yes gene_type:complete
MKKILLVGPGSSLLTFKLSNRKDYVLFATPGTFLWFYKNNITPDYWIFLDPNSVNILLKQIQNKFSKEYLNRLKKDTTILYHSLQGTDSFYEAGMSTSRGRSWNQEVFGKVILPEFLQYFSTTRILPYKILENKLEITPDTPCIATHGRRPNTCKFSSYILPTVFSLFTDTKRVDIIGFGDYENPRAYSNSSDDYNQYKQSHKILLPELQKHILNNKVHLNFLNRTSYYKPLELAKMNKITFCIPSKSNLQYLKTCIPSIRKNAYRDDHEIIVFVDSDEDGTVKWLDEVKDKYKLTYYVNPELGEKLYGIGRAYDYCINKSTTEVFMIFHADMILGNDADFLTYRELKEKTVVCATRIEPPLHPNGGEKVLMDFGMYPEEFKEEEFHNYIDERVKQFDTVPTTEGIFAPWMMYKKEYIEVLGGHDPVLHSCREDSDIFNRMLLSGFTFIQTWQGFVYHFTGRGAGSFDGDEQRHNEWKQQMNNSTKEFIRKWGSNVNHTPLMKPIVSPKYDIGLIVKSCNSKLLEVLEPWCNNIYIEDEMEVIKSHYIDKEQNNTEHILNYKIRPYNNEKQNEILVRLDAASFNQDDFKTIQQLPEIIKDSGEIGSFQLGNLFIDIIQMNEYQNTLIKL